MGAPRILLYTADGVRTVGALAKAKPSTYGHYLARAADRLWGKDAWRVVAECSLAGFRAVRLDDSGDALAVDFE